MVEERIIYDQELIDEYGYDHVHKILKSLSESNKDDLLSGIVFPAFQSKIIEEFPEFSYENLGFQKFKEFLESCIEHPYYLENDRIKLKECHEPAQTESDISQERIAEFHTALKKSQLRTLPELRKKVGDWLITTFFDATGNAKESITYSQLQKKIIDKFDSEQFSKSMIRDVFKLLVVSKIIQFDQAESMTEMPLLRISPKKEYREQLVNEVVSRLSFNGILLNIKDSKDLSFFIFGSSDSEYVEVTKNCITNQ